MCRETNFCGHKRREEQWRKAQGKRDSFVLGFYGIHVARARGCTSSGREREIRSKIFGVAWLYFNDDARFVLVMGHKKRLIRVGNSKRSIKLF